MRDLREDSTGLVWAVVISKTWPGLEGTPCLTDTTTAHFRKVPDLWKVIGRTHTPSEKPAFKKRISRLAFYQRLKTEVKKML